MLASVYSYRVMVKSVSSSCVRGRRVLSNPVTVNDLFKIITESLKLVLDAEQSGASSDLVLPTRDVQSVIFSFLFLLLRILIKTFHGFQRNSIEYFSAYISP